MKMKVSKTARGLVNTDKIAVLVSHARIYKRAMKEKQKVPSIRLTYFDLKGRAELARLCFVYGGVGFVDRRITMEKWAEVKSKTPLGQLPVLEIDGHKICQSRTIARFAAKTARLLGKTDWDEVRADMMVESLTDLELIIKKRRSQINAKDQIPRKERLCELKNKIRPEIAAFLTNYERLFVKNHKGEGWMVGDEVTYADYGWFIMAEILTELEMEDLIIDQAPKLYTLIDRVREIPETAKYIENFKDTKTIVHSLFKQ